MTLGQAYGDGFAGFRNVGGYLYIIGDEFTDDSIRMRMTDPRSRDSAATGQIQCRKNGVWNDTELSLGETLDADLRFTTVASFLGAIARNGMYFFPKIDYLGQGGTAPATKLPVLGTRVLDDEIQPVRDANLSGTEHSVLWSVAASNQPVFQVHFWTGNQVPISDVTLEVFIGTDETGRLFFSRTFAPSDFGANSKFSVILGALPSLQAGSSIYLRLISEETFDMAGDSGGDLYLARDYHEMVEETIVTFETGGPVQYSTREVALPGELWLGGQQIYRKVVNFGSLPNNNSKSVAHGIVDLDDIIDFSFPIRNNGNQRFLPWFNAGGTVAVELTFDDTNIVVTSNANVSAYSGGCILLYTRN